VFVIATPSLAYTPTFAVWNLKFASFSSVPALIGTAWIRRYVLN
jgi:hypothetical protein